MVMTRVRTAAEGAAEETPTARPRRTAGFAVIIVSLVVAFGLVPWLAHRLARPAWVGPLTSLALLGLLIPARTFQVNYLVLVVTVAATGWWLFDREPATSH